MIDVVIASYNRPDKLPRAVHSCSGAASVTVVDDASTIPLPDLPPWTGLWTRREHCAQPGRLRNDGLKATMLPDSYKMVYPGRPKLAPYVTWVDDDDYLTDDCFPDLYRFLEDRSRPEFVLTEHWEIMPDGRRRIGKNAPHMHISISFTRPLVVVRRDIFEAIGGFSESPTSAVNQTLYYRLWEKYRPALYRRPIYVVDQTGTDRISVRLADEQDANVTQHRRGNFLP